MTFSHSTTVQLPVAAVGSPSVATVGASGLLDGSLHKKRVARQLHRALTAASTDQRLTAAQRQAATTALADGDVFDATASFSAKESSRALTLASGGQASVSAIGDGSLFRLIIDNLPAILDAVERIIKLFG